MKPVALRLPKGSLKQNIQKIVTNEINKLDISNDFIPIVTIDKSYKDPKKKFGAVYNGNVDNKKTTLSKYLKNNIQLLEDIKITVPTEINLKIVKGNANANDSKGELTIISNGVIFSNKNNVSEEIILASNSIIKDVKYNSNIKIKVNPLLIEKNAYIDFYANDNDWFFYSVSNVHCGRISISNTSKIGRKITENIESLPLANNLQKLTSNDTYYNPEKSFGVANKYQNPGGMCFAITMARIGKAYTDLNIYNAIKLLTSGDDYIFSGTISNNIPEKYFGYGVGGALAKNGYADLVNTSEIWEGKLEEGAMLQFWNDPDKVGWTEIKKAIKDTLNGITNTNFHKGHSIIFKGYIFGENDAIVAVWCYDYSGIQRRFEKDDDEAHKIFLGANLRDKKF
jgi:hypothetical protein